MATEGKPAQGSERANSVASILSAARLEFGRYGLSGARISNIAQISGKTKQLIYHYYESKDQLFSEVVWDCLQHSMHNMRAPDYESMSPPDALRLFLITMSDQYRLFPDYIPIMLDENIHGGMHMRQRHQTMAVTQPVIDIFTKIIERGSRSGEFKPDLQVEPLFAASLSILSTGFFCGGVLSTFLTLDLTSDAGAESWQRYAVGLMLDAVMNGNRDGAQLLIKAD